MSHMRLVIDDASQVAEARRRAVALAASLGFDETRAGAVALAVTEAATNLIKHATRGEIIAGRIADGAGPGMEFYVVDRGPGIANVAASLRDGESSAGSPGLGLGSLTRLTSSFELYTERGKGTVLHFEVYAEPQPDGRPGGVEAAAVCVPKSGEDVAGDTWLLREGKGRAVLLVADGLGHGTDAAAAAAAARKFVWDHWEREPAELIDGIHHALKSTRGAAAAVVALKADSGVGTYCGVGNIACSVRAGGLSRSLVSHNGTLGHVLRKIQEFSFPFPPQAVLVAASDGITTRWNLADYPGLEHRSPALIAGTIFRDHERRSDDATVAVVRNVAA